MIKHSYTCIQCVSRNVLFITFDEFAMYLTNESYLNKAPDDTYDLKFKHCKLLSVTVVFDVSSRETGISLRG